MECWSEGDAVGRMSQSSPIPVVWDGALGRVDLGDSLSVGLEVWERPIWIDQMRNLISNPSGKFLWESLCLFKFTLSTYFLILFYSCEVASIYIYIRKHFA